MDDDLASVQTLVTSCKECGARTISSYHDDPQCNGLVIEVDGTFQCVECGVRIQPKGMCPSCGETASTEITRSVVSLQPLISSSKIATKLGVELQQGYSKELNEDSTLSAIASDHVSRVVEQSYFKSGFQESNLSSQLEAQSFPLGAFQTYSLQSYPDGETTTAIAKEVYSDFLTEFPDPNRELTHFGLAIEWDPKGGLHVGVIVAERLVSLSDDFNPAILEQAIHDKTNEHRTSHGYSSLKYDTHLSSIARSHSREMAIQGFFSHESPDGITTMDRYQQANFDSRWSGENIAKQSFASTTEVEMAAADVVEGWMNSPGHRENILTDGFEVEGIGLYQASDGAVFVTQNFG